MYWFLLVNEDIRGKEIDAYKDKSRILAEYIRFFEYIDNRFRLYNINIIRKIHLITI